MTENMIMLLIISFVTLSHLQFRIDKMILASVVFAVLAVIWYVIKMVRKYHGKSVCFQIGSRRKLALRLRAFGPGGDR